MNFHRRASHVFVCGKSGMGKTTFGIRYLNGCAHDRIFLFDHQNEFTTRLGIPREKVATTADEFVNLAMRERIVPFDFTVRYAGFKEEAFTEFCDLVYNVSRYGLEPQGRDCLFVCDELQQLVNAQFSPVEFKQILETGRRHNIDTLTLSRAPNRLNVSAREEFTELVFFRLDDDNSLKFAGSVGADTDLIRQLEPHEYLYYNVITGRNIKDKLEFAVDKQAEVSP